MRNTSTAKNTNKPQPNGDKNMKFYYMAQPPKKYTFEMPLLKKWVEQQCRGKVLNLFAGKVTLCVDEVRNDVDLATPAEYHLPADEFCKMAITKGMKFDTIILDPPYNLRKAVEAYNGRYFHSFTPIRRMCAELLNQNGRIITLGYDTTGLGKKRGFKKVAVCIVNHKGDHDDTLCLVEQKINHLDISRLNSKSLDKEGNL
jgi:hypothetical protein